MEIVIPATNTIPVAVASSESGLSTSLEVVAKPKRRSPPTLQQQGGEVHIPYILNGEMYEIRTQTGENVTVRCCHCPQQRIYRGSVRSTGNFHMHIKRRHPELIGRLHEMKIKSLMERRKRICKHRICGKRAAPKKRTVRTSEASASFVAADVSGQQQQQQLQLMSPQDQTPKLKIMTAYQRHQQEQQRGLNHTHSATSTKTTPIAENNSTLTMGRAVQQLQLTPFINRSSEQLSNSYETPRQKNATNCGSAITVVKNEQLMSDVQVLDLSLHSPGGISTSSSGICSTATSNLNAFFNSDNIHAAINLNTQQLIRTMESSVRTIQLELRQRYHVERSRLLLEIAKFKYLHPDFQFEA